MRLREAFNLLDLPETAAAGEVEAAWRQLRSERHPDKGGEVGLFARTKQAYQICIAHATKPRPCPVCDGMGFDRVQRGWNVVKKTCSTCAGSGKINAEEDLPDDTDD